MAEFNPTPPWAQAVEAQNSPVIDALMSNDAAVKRLDAAVDKLATRIESVLRPQAPTAAVPKPLTTVNGGSSLVLDLQKRADRLSDMAEWVESLARDVEL